MDTVVVMLRRVKDQEAAMEDIYVRKLVDAKAEKGGGYGGHGSDASGSSKGGKSERCGCDSPYSGKGTVVSFLARQVTEDSYLVHSYDYSIPFPCFAFYC